MCLLQTVNELINPWTGSWDEVLIRDNFISVDAVRILKIPLSTHLTEDFIAWHKTRPFSFSVWSAYYTEWEHQFGARIRRCDDGPSTLNPVWEILWKLQVPSKIKIFGWKALHGIIPGMSVLANRHIPVSGLYPMCKRGAENLKRLMFTCDRAKEVWLSLGLRETIAHADALDRSGCVILESLLRDKRRKSAIFEHIGFQEIILVGAWYIWWQRRESVKGEVVASPPKSALAIHAITMNYAGASSAGQIT